MFINGCFPYKMCALIQNTLHAKRKQKKPFVLWNLTSFCLNKTQNFLCTITQIRSSLSHIKYLFYTQDVSSSIITQIKTKDIFNFRK